MTTFGPSASKQAEGFYDADNLFPLHAGADGSVVGSVDMNISCAPFVATPTAPNVLPQQYKGERLHRQAKTASGVAMARGPADDDGSNGDKSAPVILILLWSMCAVVLLASATVVRRSNRRQHSTSVKLEGLSGGRTAVKHPLGYGAWVDIQRTGALERAARATTSALPKAAATDVSLTESENSIKSDLSTGPAPEDLGWFAERLELKPLPRWLPSHDVKAGPTSSADPNDQELKWDEASDVLVNPKSNGSKCLESRSTTAKPSYAIYGFLPPREHKESFFF